MKQISITKCFGWTYNISLIHGFCATNPGESPSMHCPNIMFTLLANFILWNGVCLRNGRVASVCIFYSLVRVSKSYLFGISILRTKLSSRPPLPDAALESQNNIIWLTNRTHSFYIDQWRNGQTLYCEWNGWMSIERGNLGETGN